MRPTLTRMGAAVATYVVTVAEDDGDAAAVG